MAAGPIPWRDIVAYADRFRLDHGETEALVSIVLEMDRAWLAHHAERESRGAAPDKPGGGRPPRAGRRGKGRRRR